MSQELLFDLAAGQEAKEQALSGFEVKAGVWLNRARAVAVDICQDHGSVTTDDVLEKIGMPSGMHPNVIGSIFRRGSFRRIGFQPTKRPQGHGRLIGVWVLP